MSMITQNTLLREEPSWLDYLAKAINDPQKLLEQLDLPLNQFKNAISARRLFPLRVPQPFVDKMEKGNPKDPLLLQVMTSQQEFFQAQGFSQDPLQEQQSAVPGLLHKYHNRVLLMVKGGCAVNCRYCFRRHFPYQDNKGNKQNWQTALDYIAAHPEIEEVIFSGGDPLMAKDHELDWLISRLEQIAHVKTLRIHTRLPVVIPQRITSALCQRLAVSRLNKVLVTHINHPNEIDRTFADHIAHLKAANVVLLNQAVLLKDVNDNAQLLKQLSDKLFSTGILPYYLHLLDKVQGAAHFYLDDKQALAIYRELQKISSGYLVPKLAREIAGEPNKTLLTP
ncbi:EF-P beta-lysylation protein EpmB [Testudinibacter aquarius]|uniref:L-lysine 2,3-aminomutase n=2 Tax=Testudinibacter aquarius TaxID=1524974 RepID=A0ABY2XWE9_9PAST|nr:EF-P beta-lysylation protein EpmB [Testudinibacter aquarius]KAE9525490.1 EF-P beta-lysylation protein EpmB [Testudinibacter aquarius]TNG92189.1 EF-P beta-lysylation protein EpmB [Testudinibacter aquarius]